MVLAAATSVATAQNVSLQAIAVSPIAMHAVAGVGMQSNTLPTGQQMTSANGSGAFAGVGLFATASVSWVGPTQLQNGVIEYRYVVTGLIDPSASGSSRSATVDEHEILVSLQSSAPRAIRILAEIASTATAGQPAPRLDIDLNDNGVVDGDTFSGGFETGAMLIGGSAIPLRLTVGGGAAVTNGEAAAFHVEVLLRVLPVNDVTILRTGIGCTAGLGFLVNEAFDHRGVRLGLQSALNPHVIVLGLTVHPTVVSTVGLPCILMPAPEVLVLGQPGGIDLPIPPAVRPFSFHAQAVALSAFTFQLMFSDSYYVLAN